MTGLVRTERGESSGRVAAGSVRSVAQAVVVSALLAAPATAQHVHPQAPMDGGKEEVGSQIAGAAMPAHATRAAANIDVGPRGDLDRALRNAVPGDTITLAGDQVGNFRVETPLLLRSSAGRRARLDGNGSGTTLTVTADSVSIVGLLVSGTGRSLEEDDAAIKLVRCEGCRVLDNRIEGALHGIYLLGSSATRISGNDIEGIDALEESRRGNGIHLYDSPRNRLDGNRIRRTRDGIYFSFASGNEVEDNDVAEVRYGLHYMYSDDNRFRGNRFERNAAGAALMFSKRIELRDNFFSNHVGSRAYGILLQTAEDVFADGNRIEGNQVGLFMDNATGGAFLRNAIAGNGVGIDLLSSAEGNRFGENAVVGNRIAVRRDGSGVNEWAVAGRGNYWGEVGLVDLDGDGIGDRPYEVGDPFLTLAAGKPGLALLAGTPAAHALGWAESAFPVFDLPHVDDPRPLLRPPVGVPSATAHQPEPAGGNLPALVLAALLVGLLPTGLGRVARRLATSGRLSAAPRALGGGGS